MLSGTIRSVKQGEVLFFMHTSPLIQELFPLTIHLYILLTQSYFCMRFLLIVIMQIFHSPVLNLVRMSLIESWSKSNWFTLSSKFDCTCISEICVSRVNVSKNFLREDREYLKVRTLLLELVKIEFWILIRLTSFISVPFPVNLI